jgi:hypothetical protein
MSKTNIGEYAPFDEALKIMVDKDPDADTYKKAKNPKSGTTPGASFPQGKEADGRGSIDKIKAGLKARESN